MERLLQPCNVCCSNVASIVSERQEPRYYIPSHMPLFYSYSSGIRLLITLFRRACRTHLPTYTREYAYTRTVWRYYNITIVERRAEWKHRSIERAGKFIAPPAREFSREFLERRHYSGLFRAIKRAAMRIFHDSGRVFPIFETVPVRNVRVLVTRLLSEKFRDFMGTPWKE